MDLIEKIGRAIYVTGVIGLGGICLTKAISPTYSVEGTVQQIEISQAGKARQSAPWFVPDFDGISEYELSPLALLHIQENGETNIYALRLSNQQIIPNIGENVRLKIGRFAVYLPLMGDEPKFPDGVTKIDYIKEYPSIESIEN